MLKRNHKQKIADLTNLESARKLGRSVHFGLANGNFKEGNRISGMFPCPVCGVERKCEKRNAWRKCWECHINRPSNFSRKEWHKKTKIETKKWAIDYKGGKCVICGTSDLPIVCYQFHHVDPSKKDFNPGKLIVMKPSEKLEKELDKCVLVCANCHMIIHHDKSRATNLTTLSYS
jgi:hypothetical protein